MKADIANVKKTGIAEALSKAARDALWQAKCASEKASQDGFKDFTREVKKAREYLDAASAFIDELRAQK